MKVKIGKTIYDSEETPIMVILSQEDKDNILNMHPEMFKYCSFPEDEDVITIQSFMRELD